jgi:tetratricopeptide (TPR) repeat protein
MPELLNPYIAGAPVTEASMFFGRQDVFDWIEGSLAGKYVDHILVIHGQRRVGKTSVLKQIPNHLPNRYLQVYLDLQGRAQAGLDRFLWWMSREILRTLRLSLDITIAQPEQPAFTHDPEYFHIQFLPALKPHLQGRCLLLTFDEFDILSQPETLQSLGRPLTDYISHLFELENLNFIFSIGSSGKKLENMQAAYTEFFKTALYKKISFLEQGECYQLITRPVTGVLTYDPGAVEHIYQVTSGHPYYTQLTCHELFSAAQKRESTRITRQDVDAILPDVIERGTVNLKFVWDEASELEKWALACLAQTDGIADFQTLSTELDRQHVRFSESDLNSSLLHLQEKDVLTPALRFVVHLLRLWLQTNRPLGRVREELIEINPIANRFIEIGDEYRDRREQQEALHSYQQALVVDPSNLKAQLSIAAVYLASEDWGQAAGACEHALDLDPDDIHARAGFCQAHLALGEAALARGDIPTAIHYLRRVVAVNPDHTEVRQRLADILCHQAEELLARGENEPALKAFLAAQQAIPDDEALHQRYTQVCAQVKGQVLADLLEKAGAEWKRQNWSAAIACLEEYLEFEPEAAEVRIRLDDLRRQERLNRLSALKTQAQDMERTERWDEAIAAWQDYLALQPEDRPDAERSLQAAQRYKVLAESYAQAQAALRQKEFARAIPILQGIITQQPSYKDAARLLTEAVVKERARRPVWKQRWVWAALVFVILFAISGIAAYRLPAWLASRTNNDPSLTQTLPAVAFNRTPASAIASPTQPLVTPTLPIPITATPDWVESFVQPLMDQVKGNSPDFQDDFSQDQTWTNSYGLPAEKTGAVQDGALRLSALSGETTQSLPRLATDFILQVDFQPADLADKDATFALDLRGGESSGHYRFEIDPDASTYRLSKATLSTGTTLAEGTLPATSPGSSASVQAFVSGSRLAFLWNDVPLASVSDSTYKGTNNEIVLSMPSGSATVDIDAIKLWDLNPVEVPAWMAEFVLPLIEKIHSSKPDFEEDFSSIDERWLLFNTTKDMNNKWFRPGDFIEDGSLNLLLESPSADYFLWATNVEVFRAKDFAIEFDLSPSGGDGGGYIGIGTALGTFRIRPPNSWEMTNASRTATLQSGSYSSGGNQPLHILLLLQGEHLAVILDNKPLTYISATPGFFHRNQFWFHVFNTPLELKLDNLRMWILEPQ